MPSEKKNMSGKIVGTGDETKKRQVAHSESHTEVGASEIVVSGPDATVNVNKASFQDFLGIFEHAFQKGQDSVAGKTIADREETLDNSRARNKTSRNSAFISYSRADKKYLEELHAHLAYYERSGMINFWDDTMIKPGTKWDDAINNGLQSAKVAVFLVSAEFLASDFIATRELPPLLAAAREEGTVILSVILRPCAFQDSPLAQFQAVNEPSNPLSGMPRGKRDKVWISVARYIKDALKLSG